MTKLIALFTVRIAPDATINLLLFIIPVLFIIVNVALYILWKEVCDGL